MTVLDPQGQTIQHALSGLGYAQVKDVRQGKFFVLNLDGWNREEAQKELERISKEVLNESGDRRISLRNRRMTSVLECRPWSLKKMLVSFALIESEKPVGVDGGCGGDFCVGGMPRRPRRRMTRS